MAASDSKNSIAAEFVKLFKRVEYVSTVRPLKEQETVMITNFNSLDISQWFELDTSKCFVGVKKPKTNIHCVYDIFGGYCNMDKFQVKELVTNEVSSNLTWYDRAARVFLIWKDTNIHKWLKKQKYKNTCADELCLYALCIIFRCHCIVYTMYQLWCTVYVKPGMRAEVVEEACESKLVFLGDNLFGELRRKPLTMVIPPPINLDEIQMARDLHRDPNLMEMYIVHTESSELNRQNVNIVRQEQTFIAASDTTRILPYEPTVFDIDYFPESKVEPGPSEEGTFFTLTESLGSTLGEITFPVPVKAEPSETVSEILTTHSLQCQLCTHVRDYMSQQHPDFSSEIPTEDYSTDDTILIAPSESTVTETIKNPMPEELHESSPDPLNSSGSTILCETNVINIALKSPINSQEETNVDRCLQDTTLHDASVNPTLLTSSQETMEQTPSNQTNNDIRTSSQETTDTCSQEAMSLVPRPEQQEPTNIVDIDGSSSQEVTVGTVHASQEVMDTSLQAETSTASCIAEQSVTLIANSTQNVSIPVSSPECETAGTEHGSQEATDSSSQDATLSYADPHSGSQDISTDLENSLQDATTPKDVSLPDSLEANICSEDTHAQSDPADSSIDATTGSIRNTTTLDNLPSNILRTSIGSVVGKSQPVTEDSSTRTSSQCGLDISSRRAEKIREQLHSQGFTEEIFNTNYGKSYPVMTLEQDDVDFIHFMDIIDKNWSVTLSNLSTEEIQFEVKNLKSSSPIQKSSDEPDSNITSLEGDDNSKDPEYGVPAKKKKSSTKSNKIRPGRKPSAVRIAAQELINKTRNRNKHKKAVTEAAPLFKDTNKNVSPKPKPVSRKEKKESSTNVAASTSLNKSGKETKTLNKKKSGLHVEHYGLKRHRPAVKGRHCVCSVCGLKFTSSTDYINHYSRVHPPLPCANCPKVFTNPLSLQKHQYHHIGKKHLCDVCNRQFPFSSQLKDHKKSHFQQKPHWCSFPNCNTTATHLYDVKKHERSHKRTNLKCPRCTYETTDTRNLKQHSRKHTGEEPYQCSKCKKRFKYSVQKIRHRC